MSTKYDVRVKRIEEQLNAGGKLPSEACGPYIKWWDIGAEKPDFSEIETELMERYGTVDGAEFIVMGWEWPDVGGIEPDSDETTRDPIEGT
jgi:hypothetical protein